MQELCTWDMEYLHSKRHDLRLVRTQTLHSSDDVAFSNAILFIAGESQQTQPTQTWEQTLHAFLVDQWARAILAKRLAITPIIISVQHSRRVIGFL